MIIGEISVGMIGVIITVVIQTVTIGYFIGTIKTVVERLVRDVEYFGKEFKIALNDLVIAKKDITDIIKEVSRNSGRIDLIENQVRQGVAELVKNRKRSGEREKHNDE